MKNQTFKKCTTILATYSATLLIGACQFGSESSTSTPEAKSSTSFSSAKTQSSTVILTSSLALSSASLSSNTLNSSANLLSSTALASSAKNNSSTSTTSDIIVECPAANGGTGPLFTGQDGVANAEQMYAYDCKATNKTNANITAILKRGSDHMTTHGWETAFCFGDACYLPWTAESEPMTLKPNTPVQFKFDVTNKGVKGVISDTLLVVNSNTPAQTYFTAIFKHTVQ